MSKNIGTDVAKLAGLQIDMLQKLRADQITLDHLEWFNNLSCADRDLFSTSDLRALLVAKSVSRQEASVKSSVTKFALLTDLGVITVPKNYDHATQLATFHKRNHKKFYYYNEGINDKNFANATTILVPGRRFTVKVFSQIASGTTTSEERLLFLKSQNGILVGAQGASLVFEQKRDLLPKGYWHASFDEKENLWEDSGGYHGVPDVYAYSDGGFDFNLGSFADPWNADACLLCFCDNN